MKLFFKIVDICVFIVLGYYAYNEYQAYLATGASEHDQAFAYIKIAPLVYIMLRRRDVNTVTLGIAILFISTTTWLLVPDPTTSSGFYVYSVYAVMNIVAVGLIWFRPLIFSQFKPWKGHPGFHVTKQDNVMSLVYLANTVFMLAMLLEHASRRINDWFLENSRILFDRYETIQFGFMVVGLMTLYFMTFNNSKDKRPDRKPIGKKQGDNSDECQEEEPG